MYCHSRPVNSVCKHVEHVVSGGEDGRIIVWDVANSKAIHGVLSFVT